MKSVMLSIRPKWCELIANGKKTVEVRKTRPKIETPFKCYIYCTNQKIMGEILLRDGKVFGQNKGFRENGDICLSGKVIGEFVCDCIHTFTEYDGIYYGEGFAVNGTCLTNVEMRQYGQEKDLYGWHISDLKIYDKSKELGEFVMCNTYKGKWGKDGMRSKKIVRPPQSWCYVEELEG